jgi:hypothetical protein
MGACRGVYESLEMHAMNARIAAPPKAPFLLALLVFALPACTPPEPTHNADWVIRSRVVFLSEDLQSEREPVPLDVFRLWFPLTSGDFYGSVTSGSFLDVTVNPDYTFELDLNNGHDALLKSLLKTRFSVAGMRIDPPEARIARISTFALEADGIDPIGTTEWLDADSREKLMLVYFDRPARITGPNYDIAVTQPGYVWIAQTSPHKVVPQPERLVLSVMRPESE